MYTSPNIKYFPIEFDVDGTKKNTKYIAPLIALTPPDKNMIMQFVLKQKIYYQIIMMLFH